MNRTSRRRPPLSDPAPPLSPLPPPVQPLQGGWQWALPMLVLCYLGFAFAHAWFVPLGQTGYQDAPDEAAHIAYVHTLASGHIPAEYEVTANPATHYEWHQPPLYYAYAALFLPLGDRGLRYASILLGVISILLIFRAGLRLFPNDPVMATVAAGIAALTPSHIALTSVVNNDALLEVCFSGALLIIITALFSGFTLWRGGWLGVAIGAAILTKVTGLLLLPISLLGLLLLWRSGEPPRRILQGALWMVALILAICGWWFFRNRQLYHEWLPLSAFQKAFVGTTQAADVAAGRVPGLPVDNWTGYLLLVAQWSFQSFWAVYGTPQSAHFGVPRFLQEPVYVLLAGISLAVFAGLIRLHFRRKFDFTEAQRFSLAILFATIGIVGLAFLAFILRYFQAQGRYLYPAMLPLCLLCAAGWRALFPPRYISLACGLLLMFLAAVSLAYLLQIAP